MITEKRNDILLQGDSPREGKIINVRKEKLITIEVSGDSTNFIIKAKGKVDNNVAGWYDLQAIKTDSLNIYTEIAANGIYQYEVEGLNHFCLELEEISDGEIRVFASIISEV